MGDALEQLKGAGTSAIGGIGNAGSSLISGIANPGPKTQTAEELLGVLGLLGSSYLKARSLNGSSYIGDPLGIASAGLLSNGLYAGDRNNEEARQKKLAQIIMGALPSKEGAAGPDEPEGSVLGSLIGSGEKPSEALDITKALYPTPKEPTEYELWQKDPKAFAAFEAAKRAEKAPPKLSPEEQAIADYRQQNPKATYGQAYAAVKALGRAPKTGASETELKQIYDPKTGKTRWTYEPKTGAAGTSIGEVRPPMGANAIADADATSMGLHDLKQNIKSLKLAPTQAALPNWATVLRQKAGFAASDQKVTDMLAQVSIINATLTGLVMRSWGSRNPTAAQEVIDLHVPKPTDSPSLINQKIDWWMRKGGGLDQYKLMMGAESLGTIPSESGDESDTPPLPPGFE